MLPVASFRHTRPLEDSPGLFLDFLSLKPTQREMLAFANAHGPLGVSPRMVEVDGWNSPTAGEPLWQWKRAILWMRQARELWDLASRDDAGSLRELIEVRELGETTFRRVMATYDRRIAGQDLRVVVTNLNPETRMPHVARFVVQEIVNEHLRDATSYSLAYNPGKGRFENHVQPRSLLGALWVQFSESLNPDRSYLECRQCRRWFPVAPGTKRRDSAYCSTRCRVAACEKRKREARELRLQGKTINVIAAEVGSRPQTVRGWVSDVRRGR